MVVKHVNRARCKNCGTIIESKFRHDWVACKCFNNEPDTKGIFIDGGDVYNRYGGCLENLEWLTKDGAVNDE